MSLTEFTYTQEMADAYRREMGRERSLTTIGAEYSHDESFAYSSNSGNCILLYCEVEAMKKPAEQGALKFDGEKVDVTLAPGKAVSAIAQALEYGAVKYGRDNFKQQPVLSRLRLLAGVMRHLFQDLNGELLDKDSGLPHTYHAAAGLAMLHHNYCNEEIGERFSAPGS